MATATRKKPVSLWRNRDYLLLWGGQVVSNVGSGVSQIAYPLLVLAVTSSPAQAGFVGAVRTLAYVLFVLPAGALVDRWDRKRVMIVCDTGRALALASIPVALALGHLTLAQLYISGFVEVMLSVFFDLAELACIPQVVAKEQIPAAMSRTQAALGLTNLIGPSLGGALFALRSLLPFLADAVSYVFSVGSLLLIQTPFQELRTITKRDLRAEIGEGLRWLWRQPVIRTTAFLSGGNNFLGAGFVLILIVIAQQQRASSTIIGLIFGIGGIGSILGSLASGPIRRYLRFPLIITGTLWLFALLWLPLAAQPNALLLGITTAALFFISPIYNVNNISYRLAVTPDEMQGRMNSVVRLIALGSAPLGLALTGVLLQRAGPQVTVLLSVAGQCLLALAATLSRPIRNV